MKLIVYFSERNARLDQASSLLIGWYQARCSHPFTLRFQHPLGPFRGIHSLTLMKEFSLSVPKGSRFQKEMSSEDNSDP